MCPYGFDLGGPGTNKCHVIALDWIAGRDPFQIDYGLKPACAAQPATVLDGPLLQEREEIFALLPDVASEQPVSSCLTAHDN